MTHVPEDEDALEGASPHADPLADEQAAAAAAEAGAIGGRNPDPVDSPARPLREAGQGEAEGFDQAEQQLIAQASHEDPPTSPTQDAFAPERESDLASADYGEADGPLSQEEEGQSAG